MINRSGRKAADYSSTLKEMVEAGIFTYPYQIWMREINVNKQTTVHFNFSSSWHSSHITSFFAENFSIYLCFLFFTLFISLIIELLALSLHEMINQENESVKLNFDIRILCVVCQMLFRGKSRHYWSSSLSSSCSSSSSLPSFSLSLSSNMSKTQSKVKI